MTYLNSLYSFQDNLDNLLKEMGAGRVIGLMRFRHSVNLFQDN